MAVAEEQHRASLEGEAAEARSRTERDLQQLGQQRSEAETELVEPRQEVVTTREAELLHEAGIYQYAHTSLMRWPTRPSSPHRRTGSRRWPRRMAEEPLSSDELLAEPANHGHAAPRRAGDGLTVGWESTRVTEDDGPGFLSERRATSCGWSSPAAVWNCANAVRLCCSVSA
jgi:hypothetical protein